MTQPQQPGNKDPRTYAIIGAAMEVHRELGCGFLEPAYQEAMELEMGDRALPHRREAELPIHYKGRRLRTDYRPDFICFDEVVVELKALPALTSREEAQVINYLKAGKFEVGLLINFGRESLEYKRLVLSKGNRSA